MPDKLTSQEYRNGVGKTGKLKAPQVEPVYTDVEELSVHVPIKPLSVNAAWKGQRFKTDAYKEFERAVLFMLPVMQLPRPPYRLYLALGLSDVRGDFDNPVKMILDIMQKKYGFNDRDIHEAHIVKRKTGKGGEYFRVSLYPLPDV